MSKLDVKATLKRLGLKQKEIAAGYYGRTPKDEAEAKSVEVIFGRAFARKDCNPTLNSLQRLANVLHIDVVQLFSGDNLSSLDYTSPETGKHYLMIPLD